MLPTEAISPRVCDTRGWDMEVRLAMLLFGMPAHASGLAEPRQPNSFDRCVCCGELTKDDLLTFKHCLSTRDNRKIAMSPSSRLPIRVSTPAAHVFHFTHQNRFNC